MRDELSDACAFLRGEVQRDLPWVALELLQDSLAGYAEDVMYFVNLVELVVTWEEREQTQNFEEHAAHPPYVHLVVIVAVREEALRRAVPPSRDILLTVRGAYGEGLFRVDALA